MVKTITITEDAYNRLKAVKEENESFSDVIKKTIGSADVTEIVGLLTKEEAAAARKKITDARKASTKRAEEIRKRLQKLQ